MKGYSATELLVTLVVIAIIITVAFPVYRNYLSSSKASDSLETIAVLEEQLTIMASTDEGRVHICDDLLVRGKGLENAYVTQSIVPLPTGEAALAISAKVDVHGGDGIQVAKALLEELNGLQKSVSTDVVGDALVSYKVRLTPEGRVFCDNTSKPAVQTAATTNAPKTPPEVAKPPSLSFSFTTTQEVLEFPNNGRGSVINNGPLQTGGDIRDLAVEFNVMGGQQVATQGYHGATFLSYGVAGNQDEFYAWRPTDLTVRINRKEYRTGIDTTDGQSHRYSILWSSDTGRLQVLVDGVVKFTEDSVSPGYAIPGNGVLALAQDQDRFQIEDGTHANNHGFSTNDAFHGQFFSASMANAKVNPDSIKDAPLASALNKDNGLITDIRMSGGQATDLTGKHQLTTSGMSSRNVPVDTSIATPNPGATLKLEVQAQPQGNDQLTGLEISGFLSSTELSDSGGNATTGTAQNILTWDYANLQAKLPAGQADNMRIKVTATVTGINGDTATETVSRSLVLDPTKSVPAD